MSETKGALKLRPARKSGDERKGPTQAKPQKQDLSASYNAFKMFEGKVYTGAKVGRGQRWYYDKGEWKEHKVEPDKWEFTYDVKKRRAGNAPEGSGAPVGTEYHWYILAHQIVSKLNANDYNTSMTGLKYKLSHKRADKEKWASSDKAQRKRLIEIFEEMIAQLKEEPEAVGTASRRKARTGDETGNDE